MVDVVSNAAAVLVVVRALKIGYADCIASTVARGRRKRRENASARTESERGTCATNVQSECTVQSRLVTTSTDQYYGIVYYKRRRGRRRARGAGCGRQQYYGIMVYYSTVLWYTKVHAPAWATAALARRTCRRPTAYAESTRLHSEEMVEVSIVQYSIV